MVPLPAGSMIYMNAVYDNTSDNPDNPNNPPQWTFWGDGTEDEMFFIAFRFLSYQEGDENIYLGGSTNYLLGDINQDDAIDVLDIVTMVQFILEFSNPTEVQFESADINQDGVLNIIDVLTLVDFVQANNAGSLNPYLADVNADETINFLDMISIVREIMGF